MKELYKFSFQKEHRELGCEDAPPIAEKNRLIVCDGLGGSGKDKIPCMENGSSVIRTSAYLGSRILASYVDSFIEERYDALCADAFSREEPKTEDFRPFVLDLFKGLDDAYAEKRMELGIAAPQVGQKMLFPSTLASCVMAPHEDKLRILLMWAGDSRVYFLSPTKGLMQLSMDDSAEPFDSLHSTSHMRNCLAHQRGRVHHINYAYYETDEPGMLFACSDGVTDYLPSPMTLERVMLLFLRTQYDSTEPDYPSAFAEKMSRVFFRTIYDDTTMAGVFVDMKDMQDYEKHFGFRAEGMMPTFEKADELLHDEDGSRILGIFRNRQVAAEDRPKFRKIWEKYEPGYQEFRRIDIRRVYEDEL